VDEVIEALIEQGVISHRHGERYAVAAGFQAPALLLVDRAAAAQFGIRTYAQHLNGYLRAGRHLQLWLGRRVRTKRNFPSRLDNTAAGGLPYGITPADNLAKECWEEAGISLALAQTAIPVGAVSYCMETPLGLRRDTLFTYDLELPADFEPRCVDGEMEAYQRLPLEAVATLVRDTEEVKPNSALVLIDFLIRHGALRPGHPDYLELVRGLHR
jgi:8-oxo-dGTP pyrophosphatase MutT (NUDIX family)